MEGQGVEALQEQWLRDNIQPHFARKLIKAVTQIAQHVLARDGNPDHAFPHLAGSHLTQVRPRPLIHPGRYLAGPLPPAREFGAWNERFMRD